MSEGPIFDTADGCTILLHVVPRASNTKLVGLYDGRLKLQVAAPPVDGAANQAILKFFAKRLGVRQDQLEIASGQTGKRKSVKVTAKAAAQVASALGLESAT